MAPKRYEAAPGVTLGALTAWMAKVSQVAGFDVSEKPLSEVVETSVALGVEGPNVSPDQSKSGLVAHLPTHPVRLIIGNLGLNERVRLRDAGTAYCFEGLARLTPVRTTHLFEGIFVVCTTWADANVLSHQVCALAIAEVDDSNEDRILGPLLRLCLPLDVFMKVRECMVCSDRPRVRELMPQLIRSVRTSCAILMDLTPVRRHEVVVRLVRRICEWLVATTFAPLDGEVFPGGPESKPAYSLLKRLVNPISLLASFLRDQKDSLLRLEAANILRWVLAQNELRFPREYQDVRSILLCEQAIYMDHSGSALDLFKESFAIETSIAEARVRECYALEIERRGLLERLTNTANLGEDERKQLEDLEERKRKKLDEAFAARTGRATNMHSALNHIMSAGDIEELLRARHRDVDDLLMSLTGFFRREQPNHRDRMATLQHAACLYMITWKQRGNDKKYLLKAEECLNEILRHRPERLQTHPVEFKYELTMLASVLRHLEEWPRARHMYEAVIKHLLPVAPDLDAPSTYRDYAKVLLKLQQFNMAIHYLREANNLITQKNKTAADPLIAENLLLLSSFYKECAVQAAYLHPAVKGELEHAAEKLERRRQFEAATLAEATGARLFRTASNASDRASRSSSPPPRRKQTPPPKKLGSNERKSYGSNEEEEEKIVSSNSEKKASNASNSAGEEDASDGLGNCEEDVVEVRKQWRFREEEDSHVHSLNLSGSGLPSSARSEMMRARHITPMVRQWLESQQASIHHSVEPQEEKPSAQSAPDASEAAKAELTSSNESKFAPVPSEANSDSESDDDDDDDEYDDEDEEDENYGEDGGEDDAEDGNEGEEEDGFDPDHISGNITDASTLPSGDSSVYVQTLVDELSKFPPLPNEWERSLYEFMATVPESMTRPYYVAAKIGLLYSYFLTEEKHCYKDSRVVLHRIVEKQLLNRELKRLERLYEQEQIAEHSMDSATEESDGAAVAEAKRQRLLRQAELAHRIGTLRRQCKTSSTEKSIQMFRKALELRIQAVPTGDSETLIDLDDLANEYVRLGQYEDAVLLFERTALWLRSRGPSMRIMLARAIGNQAMATELKGDLNGAAALYAESISTAENEPQLARERLVAQRKLMECYAKSNRLEEALQMGEQLLCELAAESTSAAEEEACAIRLMLCPILQWADRLDDAERELGKAEVHMLQKYQDQRLAPELLPLYRTGAALARARHQLRVAEEKCRIVVLIMQNLKTHDLALFYVDTFFPVLLACAEQAIAENQPTTLSGSSSDNASPQDPEPLPKEASDRVEEIINAATFLLTDYKFPALHPSMAEHFKALVHRTMAAAFKLKRRYKHAHDHLLKAFSIMTELVQHDLQHPQMIALNAEMDEMRDLMEEEGINREEQDEEDMTTEELPVASTGTTRENASPLSHTDGGSHATEQIPPTSMSESDSEAVRRFAVDLAHTGSVPASEAKDQLHELRAAPNSAMQQAEQQERFYQDPTDAAALGGAGTQPRRNLRSFFSSMVGPRRSFLSSHTSSQRESNFSSNFTSPRNGLLSPTNSARLNAPGTSTPPRSAPAQSAQGLNSARSSSKHLNSPGSSRSSFQKVKAFLFCG